MTNNYSRRSFLRNETLNSSLVLMVASGLNSGEITSAPTVERKLPREVLISSVSQAELTASTSEQMTDSLMQILEEKGIYCLDVICLPETLQTANVNATFTTPEKFAAGEIAVKQFSYFTNQKKHYIICPLDSKVNDRVYNPVILIDR